MKKIAVSICVVLSYFLLQGVAYAQPMITSVTGTISNGSLLTIKGIQFNAETKLNWNNFFVANPFAWSFEGGSLQEDGYGQGFNKNGTYVTDVKLLGGKSVRFHTQGASSNCPFDNLGADTGFNPSGGDSGDYWIRYYARWSLNSGRWPRSYIKMISTFSGNHALERYYFQPVGDPNGNFPTQFLAAYEGAGQYLSIPSGQLENNRWYAIELHWKSTSPTAYDVWIDGTQVGTASPGAAGLDMLEFGIINLCGTDSNFSLDHFVDGLVVSSSRVYPSALVEVGDSPNYGTARKNFQALETISDNQIVFKLNITNLGTGPYYVWVRNNAQTITSAFPLGQSTVPPASPTTLRILP